MTASLRPGRDSAWLKRLTDRVLSNVAASEATITTHCSSWLHDLDQVCLCSADHYSTSELHELLLKSTCKGIALAMSVQLSPCSPLVIIVRAVVLTECTEGMVCI